MLVSREIGFKAQHSHRGMLLEPKHGHDYVCRLIMHGEANEEGFVCDFRAVKRIFKRVVASRLEGADLDSLLEYPTSENLAAWIWKELEPFFPLHSVELREKPHSAVIYFGPHHETEDLSRHSSRH